MKKLICVLLVLVMALSLTACGGSGYKGVVKDYINALNKGDAEKMLELYPEEFIEYMIDEAEYYEDEDDLEDLQDYYDDEYGIDVKDAKELEVELTIKGDDDEDEEDVDLIVIKVGSKWYLDVDSGF